MPRLKKEVVLAREKFVRDFFKNHPAAKVDDAQKAIQDSTGMRMAPPRLKELYGETRGTGTTSITPAASPVTDDAKIDSAYTPPSDDEDDAMSSIPLAPDGYVPQTPISDEQKKTMYSELCDRMNDMMDHYNADNIPDRVKFYANRIYAAPDLQIAKEVRHKTLQKLQIHFLAMWSKHRILGPDSLQGCLKRSKEADNLANFLESKNDLQGARRERQRAARMRAKATELRALQVEGVSDEAAQST